MSETGTANTLDQDTTSTDLIDIEQLLAPVSDDAPGGDTCQYEPEYEAIEREIAKLSAIEPVPPEWQAVKENALVLLQEKSKDMHVASFLAVSMLQSDGAAGLSAALEVIDGLLELHWDELHPPVRRMRGRAGAMQWLCDTLNKQVPKFRFTPEDGEHLDAVYARLEAIATFCQHKIEVNTPEFAETLRAINTARGALSAMPVAPASLTTPQSGDITPTPESTAADPVPQHSDDRVATEPSTLPTAQTQPAPITGNLESTIQDAHNYLIKLADSIRGSRVSDPRHFIVNRLGLWFRLNDAPLNDNGKTQLHPPSREVVRSIQKQIDEGQCEEAIEAIERVLQTSPFWFEGNRLSALAMDDAGKKFVRARASVIAMTREFLRRFPELPALRFADDSLFAPNDLMQWLDTEDGVTPSDASGQAFLIDDQSTIDPEQMAAALSAARKGDLDTALQEIEAIIASLPSGRERFELRLKQAEICAMNDRFDMSVPLLERLDRDQIKRDLQSWEPLLSVRVMLSLLDSYAKLKNKAPNEVDRINQKFDEVFERLCQLDPSAALKISRS